MTDIVNLEDIFLLKIFHIQNPIWVWCLSIKVENFRLTDQKVIMNDDLRESLDVQKRLVFVFDVELVNFFEHFGLSVLLVLSDHLLVVNEEERVIVEAKVFAMLRLSLKNSQVLPLRVFFGIYLLYLANIILAKDVEYHTLIVKGKANLLHSHVEVIS